MNLNHGQHKYYLMCVEWFSESYWQLDFITSSGLPQRNNILTSLITLYSLWIIIQFHNFMSFGLLFDNIQTWLHLYQYFVAWCRNVLSKVKHRFSFPVSLTNPDSHTQIHAHTLQTLIISVKFSIFLQFTENLNRINCYASASLEQGKTKKKYRSEIKPLRTSGEAFKCKKMTVMQTPQKIVLAYRKHLFLHWDL